MDIQIDTALADLVTTSDPALKIIYEYIDQDYTHCIMDIREGTTRSHLIQQLKNIKSDISVNENLLMIDAKRIILPKNAIKPIMDKLTRRPRRPRKDREIGPATLLLAKYDK